MRRVWSTVLPTLRYWMRTEVHVFAFSIAANVLLSFFPFLIVVVSLASTVFPRETTVAAIDLAMRDFFPDALGKFLHDNLPYARPVGVFSMVLLLFTANGIFEPMEVALNHVWGIRTNRSFARNQAVSLVLIFACGGLELISLGLPALGMPGTPIPGAGAIFQRMVGSLFFKFAAVPITSLILFLVYRYLPNGRPPLNRVIPAAIGVGVLLEGLKYANLLIWPWVDKRIAHEYGVFRYSVTLIFLSFLSSMLVLGGAEWAARGHQLDGHEQET